tara:strand:+ start:2972 stop:3424 length:453 start_codon:yes stop_codon:yes gene_type:complete
MKNIITLLLTLLFLTNCGYTPIYSDKNFDFKIENIVILKNNKLNNKIKKRLKNFSNQNSQKIILLEVDAKKIINTLVKDSRGDPSRYEMIIDIKLKASYGLNKNVNRSFEERFSYNGNKNKFELKQYEKEIENLLINKNMDRIIVYLSEV